MIILSIFFLQAIPNYILSQTEVRHIEESDTSIDIWHSNETEPDIDKIDQDKAIGLLCSIFQSKTVPLLQNTNIQKQEAIFNHIITNPTESGSKQVRMSLWKVRKAIIDK